MKNLEGIEGFTKNSRVKGVEVSGISAGIRGSLPHMLCAKA